MDTMTVCLQLKFSKLKSVSSLFGYSESVENLEPEHSEAVAEAILINELPGAKKGETCCTCQWHSLPLSSLSTTMNCNRATMAPFQCNVGDGQDF